MTKTNLKMLGMIQRPIQVITILIAIFAGVSIFAVPASPAFREVIQPNGVKIEVRNVGDEFYNWQQTKGGYAVKKDIKSGYYEYLQVDPAGQFVNTGQRVGSVDPSSIGVVKDAVESTEIILEQRVDSPFAPQVVEVAAPEDGVAMSSAAPQLAVSAFGEKRMIVLLAQFSDASITYSQADFDGLYNDVVYKQNGANGSVKDYYTQNSYGQLTLVSSVQVWVKLPNTRKYYSNKAAEMVIDAINAVPVTVNWTRFDMNGDGVLDLPLDIIHTGLGQEQTGDSNDIWSHASTLTNAQAFGIGTGPVTKDGVKIDEYHTEPEKTISGGISTIGVICHETGHALGLPDLYDTTGVSEGLGSWAIMAAGSWNGGGTRPSHFCSWSKIELGWITPTVITYNQNGLSIPFLSSNAKVYKIATGGVANKEYFLIENRAKVGFDDNLPSAGLLVYHIDDNNDPAIVDGMASNTDNNWPHYRVRLMQADGLWNLEENENRGDIGDPYPGYYDNRTIDSSTDPNTNSYYNAPDQDVVVSSASGNPNGDTATEIEITNISDPAYSMTFDAKIDDSDFLTVSSADPNIEISELSIIEGQNGTFKVKLTKEPASEVIINLTSSDTDEATVDASVTFTTSNWMIPKTVTVHAVDDVYAGDDTAIITVKPDASSDIKYKNIPAKEVAITCVSNELAEITVTPHKVSPLVALYIDEVDQGGTPPSNTGTFSIDLAGRPRTDVTVKIQSLDTDEVTVNFSTLTFTTDDWDTPQDITVTAVDDSFVGDDTAYVQFSIVVASSDAKFKDTPAVEELVECIDDESPPIGTQTATFTLSSEPAPLDKLTINETSPGNTGTFTCVLNGKPHVPVKINLLSSNTAEAKMNKSVLTFTKDNWDTPQTVIVTAVNDNLVGDRTPTMTGSVDATSDPHFISAPDDTVIVTVVDDDDAGFTVTPVTLSMGENYETKEFTVVLTKGPVDSGLVKMTVVSGDTTEATVTPANLTFDKTNWNIPQKVRVTSVPDHTLGNDTTTVTVTVDDANTVATWVTKDPLPAHRPIPQTVAITLINDDVAGFVLSTKTLTVVEGLNDNYSMVLTAQPDAGETVTINATSSNTAEVDLTNTNVATTAITFTTADWNTPHPVQVNGVEDVYATDDKANVVNTVDTSSDPNFRNLALQSVAVTVTNDDALNSAQLLVDGALADSTLIINEIAPGNTGNFTVALDAKPHSNVVVSVVSLQLTEAVVDLATLTFTPSNWNNPQLVTATSVANNYMGNGTSNVRLRVVDAQSDVTFRPATDRVDVVTITDNDPQNAGVGISSTETAMVLMQNAGRGTFKVSLGGRPRTNVRLDFTSDDLTIAKVSPAYVIFNKTSWATPKTITITGDPTRQNLADSTAIITIDSNKIANYSDQAWVAKATVAGLDTINFDVTIVSDLLGGFAVNPTTLDVDEMVDTTPFTVVLNQEPTADVTINVAVTASGPTGTVTLSVGALTFNPTGGVDPWYNPQTIDITSDGTNIVDDEFATITCSVAVGSDASFLALPDKSVAVTVKNLNPVANDDVASAMNNKVGMTIANEPVLIHVLNNDTDPGDIALTIASVTNPAGAAGGVAELTADDSTISSQVIRYTPAAEGTAIFTYIATNSLGGLNDNSYSATVTVTVEDGQPVTYGSVVELTAGDVGGGVVQFTRRPSLYVNYYDPIRYPIASRSITDRLTKYSLIGLSRPSVAIPLGTVDNEWRKIITLYNRRTFSVAYRNGTFFDDYIGQVTSLLCENANGKASEGGIRYDNAIAWNLLVVPPQITAIQRFTTPNDDLTLANPRALAGWTNPTGDLHSGSIMHVIGKYFGSRVPRVWLEYKDSRGRVRMARCRVLRYKPYADGRGKANNSYMDVDPTSATYGASELKVMMPTRWPRGWVFDDPAGYTLIIDNRIGMASFAGLVITDSASNNTAPTCMDDLVNGGDSIKANSRNNEVDIIDNDEFPNCDEVNVIISNKPDSGGRVRWDRNKAKIIYTPARDFTGDETFSYKVIEKYTDQKLESNEGTVQITVIP